MLSRANDARPVGLAAAVGDVPTGKYVESSSKQLLRLRWRVKRQLWERDILPELFLASLPTEGLECLVLFI